MDALQVELPLETPQPPGSPPIAVGRGVWERAAATAARRTGFLPAEAADTDVLAALSRRTVDGVHIPALGTLEDLTDLDTPGLPGRPPFVRGARRGPTGGPQGSWDIRSHVQETDPVKANQRALWELEHGASSIWLRVGSTGTSITDLPVVLAWVYLDFGPVVFEPDPGVSAATLAAAFADLLLESELRASPSSNLGVDPIGQLARYGSAPTSGIADQTQVSDAAATAQRLGIRALVVDATVINDCGGTDVQELAYALGTGLAYLRMIEQAGIDLATGCGLIEFRYAATDEQFPTIGKLRAARRLWDRLTQLCGVGPEHRGQAQHAVTSAAMLTRYDPWVNMIRGTVAGFAAGVGGAESVTVRPFDEALGEPDVLGLRVSRNTSLLLLQESNVGVVQDPAGGAYAVEVLTDRLAQAAWAEFQQVDAAGGVVAALADGSLAARLAQSSRARRQRIADRRQPITGVTDFPLRGEIPLVRTPVADWPTGPGALTVVHYADDYEQLRDNPGNAKVFLLREPGARVAAVSWAENVLTAGGIDFVGGATSEFAEARCSVVAVVTASAAPAPDLIAELRAAGATWVVLVNSSAATLDTTGADDHFVLGDDLLGFLTRTREHLVDTT